MCLRVGLLRPKRPNPEHPIPASRSTQFVLAQFFVPSFVVAHHEGHKHSNLADSDHSHSSSDIISLRKDVRRLIEKCHVVESAISC